MPTSTASCALPGYFSPVKIRDDTYIDGGSHSPTNAAILRERDLDLVVVVSPMSGPSGLPTDLYGASRWHAGRLTRREVNALRSRGADVVLIRCEAHTATIAFNATSRLLRAMFRVDGLDDAAAREQTTAQCEGLLAPDSGRR